MEIKRNGKVYDDCGQVKINIDINDISKALVALKENPDINTTAYYDENGNYVIKKLVPERNKKTFREMLGFKAKTSNNTKKQNQCNSSYAKFDADNYTR